MIKLSERVYLLSYDTKETVIKQKATHNNCAGNNYARSDLGPNIQLPRLAVF